MFERNMKISIFLAVIFALICFVSKGSVYGSDPSSAQEWVEEGLEIGKTMPNSDAEARCYIKAIQIDSDYSSAHFNLAYVLDFQAMENWRGENTAWDDVGKLYKALNHYARSIQLDPQRSAACENASRIAKLLLDAETKQPPDLYLLRSNLSMCLESTSGGQKIAGVCSRTIKPLIVRIEKRLNQLTKVRLKDGLMTSQEITRKLERSFTRGASPYQGPRVPLTIHFDVNKATIRTESALQLKEIARAIKSPRLIYKIILIEGHADSQGPADYNLELSKRRAASIKQYLASNFGIDAKRIEIRGYGESRPLVPNDTQQNRAMNRRVEFVNKNELNDFKGKLNDKRRSGEIGSYDFFY